METKIDRFSQFSRAEKCMMVDALYTEWNDCRSDGELGEYCDQLYELIDELKRTLIR